jgi:hypothetical protein
MSYKTYFQLPNIKKPILLHKALNRGYMFVFKKYFYKNFESNVLDSIKNKEYGLNKDARDLSIEVSLTSFPARINEVYITIETIFLQTVKADNITLWLSLEQFPDRVIPKELEEQKNRGLTVEFVADDLRSHKKYYYAFKRQKDNVVITFDDDVFYPENTIESLLQGHLKFPKAVICNRGHKIEIKDENVLSYKNWCHNYNSCLPSNLAVPTGVGGVLYPPDSYHLDIFNIADFKEICFYADDLWLKIQTLRKNTKVYSLRTYPRDFINVGKSQQFKLVQYNAMDGGNDSQFCNLLNHYQLSSKDFQDAK